MTASIEWGHPGFVFVNIVGPILYFVAGREEA